MPRSAQQPPRRPDRAGPEDAASRLALRTDVLEVLDVGNVDGLTSLDVADTNLIRCLSVRSCFRFPTGGDGVAAVSAPRIAGGPLAP